MALTLPKICCKLGKEVEDSFEKGVYVPMKRWHTSLGGSIPSVKIRIVQKVDELEQNLAIKGLRSGAIEDGGNDDIAVDAEAGDVGHVDHGAYASDCDICFRFVSIGYHHTVLRISGEVIGALFVNHGGILLGEE
jgi:hypothetical protein